MVRPGIDPAERDAALERLDRLAWLLDSALRIPGTGIRVGLDGILGLIPVAGDTAAAGQGFYILYEGWRLGASKLVLGRMAANWGIDWVIGLVPLVGDILDIGFKAHRRNVELLRRHLTGDSGGYSQGPWRMR